ncbi:PREDICTED: fibroblast growth factor 2 [Hipposideros armiger]|uniref:Fibroblast growth factor n=1 Tax=Hipposideros armiger TaxID=186990 RepID=A0A8B7Q6K8_HIPAR|nr:PREDICTED: fibroblast growth factor 2 [Hipposideros armiger]
MEFSPLNSLPPQSRPTSALGAERLRLSLMLGTSVKLQLQAEERGVVSIKGVCANRYLAMKEDGRLLASKCVTDECFFFERLESNNYNTYRSRKYSSWYVALKRTGQFKLGPKTGPGQKAILFLPMSAKS